MFMPSTSELVARGKESEIKKTHKSITKWIFMANLAFFLIMVLFPDNVLGVLFGEEYKSASMALLILAAGYIISMPGILSGDIITALGKTKMSLYIIIMASTVNFIVNLALIPHIGMTGRLWQRPPPT